jgi:SAM-dependent methyltransferase
MDADTLAAITDDLTHIAAEAEDPTLRRALVAGALPRLVRTIDLIPEDRRTDDVLQLGAEPYLLTLCLRRVCRGRLAMVNYFGTDYLEGRQELVDRRSGERLQLTYEHFNIEEADFPYPDASFGLVTLCEIIEHLVVNPVRVLAEIHRVLRPDGVVIVTTPNAISLQRFEGFLRGRTEIVDRYSPGFGAGARHNREYRPYELRELLESTGFVLEAMDVRDLVPPTGMQGIRRAFWRRVLRWYADHPRGEHIFVRARRGPQFRWTFPSNLFDHLEFYVLVREPWLEMGVNDSIQCAFGWFPVDVDAGASPARRWTRGTAQALLRAPADVRAVRVVCRASTAAGARALPVRIIVRHRFGWPRDPAMTYADVATTVGRGDWCTVEVPIPAGVPAGEPIEVAIIPEPDPGDAAALATLPEHCRGLAVHRVWFVT